MDTIDPASLKSTVADNHSEHRSLKEIGLGCNGEQEEKNMHSLKRVITLASYLGLTSTHFQNAASVGFYNFCGA